MLFFKVFIVFLLAGWFGNASRLKDCHPLKGPVFLFFS